MDQGGQGLAVRGEAGAITPARETTTAHSAALAKAEVEARFALAVNRPRSMDDARTRLVTECRRPGFAEAAIYSLPRGEKKVEGLSIRFVEAAVRCMGNIDVRAVTVFEGVDQRIVRVTVTELEVNATYSSDITISKTVERKSLKRGQTPLGTRTNSYGDTVYLVEATDDELVMKQAQLVSKAVRTLGLRLVPGDIQDECFALVKKTAADKTAEDPTAARKKIVDGFFALGVRPTDLEKHLGHALDGCSPAELDDLRALYVGIRDGELTWKEVADSGESEEGSDEAKRATAKLDSIKSRIAAKSGKTGQARTKAPDEATESGCGSDGLQGEG